MLEVEAVPAQMGPENMHGVGFDVAERVLRSEGEAVRDCAHERSRVWKVGRPTFAGGGVAEAMCRSPLTRRARAHITIHAVHAWLAASFVDLSSVQQQSPSRACKGHTPNMRTPASRTDHAPQVQNPNVLNPTTGKPVAFKIMPATPCPPMLAHVRRGEGRTTLYERVWARGCAGTTQLSGSLRHALLCCTPPAMPPLVLHLTAAASPPLHLPPCLTPHAACPCPARAAHLCARHPRQLCDQAPVGDCLRPQRNEPSRCSECSHPNSECSLLPRSNQCPRPFLLRV